MNTIFRKTNLLLIIFSVVILSSCKKDEETAILTPSVTFGSTTMAASFFTVGETEIPTLVWNGNQGTFSLGSAIAGLSVNSTTGQVSWTKELPLGTHNIQLVASNSAGQTVVNLSIENTFASGDFNGFYNYDPTSTEPEFADYEFFFKNDNTVTLDIDNDDKIDADGSWSIAGNSITSTYTYGGSLIYTVQGELVNTASEAYIEGFWYPGDAVIDVKSGYFKIDYVP